jgi:hypothetical protein
MLGSVFVIILLQEYTSSSDKKILTQDTLAHPLIAADEEVLYSSLLTFC